MRFAGTWRLHSCLTTLLSHRGLLVLGWLGCTVLILVVGLWPLNFHPVNDVAWLQSENGLAFTGNGEAYVPQSLEAIVHNNPSNKSGFAIELLLRPRRQDLPHVAYVLSDETVASKPSFLLLQYGSMLILQTYFEGGNDLKLRKLGVDILVPAQLIQVSVVSGKRGTEFYVNGFRKDRYPDPIAADQIAGPLVLGNSGGLNYPWVGDLLGLAFYDYEPSADQMHQDALAWLARQPNHIAPVQFEFAEKSGNLAHPTRGAGVPLQVPRNLTILNRPVLVWDLRLNASGLWDIVENIFGFVPFGFFGAALLVQRKRPHVSALLVVVAGFAISLLIELTQSRLPFRDSSLVDLVMNTAGTIAGAACVLLIANPGK
jgi:VanZ like family